MKACRWVVGAVSLLAGVPLACFAGPNTGGFLLLHVNDSVTYTTDLTTYDNLSGVESPNTFGCPDLTQSYKNQINATSSKAVGETAVFWALAVFQEETCPSLAGLVFGIDYNPNTFIVVASGSLGDFELQATAPNGDPWPAPQSATAITFNSPRHSRVDEVYWFAGYAYTAPSTFSLTPHRSQGADFADGSQPAILDHILGFGTVGMGGAPGVIPTEFTPTQRHTWGKVKSIFGR